MAKKTTKKTSKKKTTKRTTKKAAARKTSSRRGLRPPTGGGAAIEAKMASSDGVTFTNPTGRQSDIYGPVFDQMAGMDPNDSEKMLLLYPPEGVTVEQFSSRLSSAMHSKGFAPFEGKSFSKRAAEDKKGVPCLAVRVVSARRSKD